MKRPITLTVGFRKYRIRSPSAEEKKNTKYNGLALVEHNEIRLRDDVSDDEQKATLFHEYLHAKISDAGVPLSSAKEEERLCQFFSSCVMELVRDPDNWKLLQWAHERQQKITAPENTPGFY